MKHAILLSPYFTPSNIACVQRVRLMAAHLHEFGWKPTVVTVESSKYEEANDESSATLLSPQLVVERVSAWPAKICRPLGFGDISLRAQWQLRRKVADLIRRKEADLVFATVLPGYTSLVGAWAKRKFGLPFVLDYQDPWVSNSETLRMRLSKAGLARWFAKKLEPRAVAAADALTAVSGKTLDTLRERRLIRKELPVEIVPIGADEKDHVAAASVGRSWIQRGEDEFVIAYFGTIIEPMLPSVRTLFRAVRLMIDANPSKRVSIHFVGTSGRPKGRDAYKLQALADGCGVGKIFRLEPCRICYLDALRSMQDADLLLLIGSTDSHYTASKLFPCWLARKAVVGLFHSASTVNNLARELGGVRILTYDNRAGAETRLDAVAATFREIREHGLSALDKRIETAFARYSSVAVARRYAALFDRLAAAASSN